MSSFNYNELPEAGDRYVLGDALGAGVHGRVFCAQDTENPNRRVAVKIQKYNKENELFVHQEHLVLKSFQHPNLPTFYGIYKNDSPEPEVWFVIEVRRINVLYAYTCLVATRVVALKQPKSTKQSFQT